MSDLKSWLVLAAVAVLGVVGAWMSWGEIRDRDSVIATQGATIGGLRVAIEGTQDALNQQHRKSEDLLRDLARRDAALAAAEEEIRNANFTPKSTAPVGGQCRGHAVDSPEFVRLFNAAGAHGLRDRSGHSAGYRVHGGGDETDARSALRAVAERISGHEP
jgi:hypothetical protein